MRTNGTHNGRSLYGIPTDTECHARDTTPRWLRIAARITLTVAAAAILLCFVIMATS